MTYPLLLTACLAVVVCLTSSAGAQGERSTFQPGTPTWTDTDGEPIQAHGGQILEHEGVYYWYGEQRGRGVTAGVRCYSSSDLYNWKDEGLILEATGGEATDLQPGSVMERPKVVFNEETGKFVLWFHLELAGMGYAAARTGCAVGDGPTGSFSYQGSYRPNPGVLPVDAPIGSVSDREDWMADVEKIENNREQATAGKWFLVDLRYGQMARDMTVFVDDDADRTAYHVASSEENVTLHINKLTDDYTKFTGIFSRALPGDRNEAPAIFKHEGKYYMIASGLTGWDPNEARSHVADDILGEWTPLGNPCVGGPNPHNGIGVDKTFGAQSTHVMPAPGHEGEGKFIAMFDVWQPKQGLQTSRYVWLPLTMEDGLPVVHWVDEWDLSWFDTDHEVPVTEDRP